MILCIIIVTFNNQNSIRELLIALHEQAESLVDVSTSIIVVDNNSNDDSVNIIKKEFPGVQLIINKVNVGFGAACNQAMRLTESATHFALINPDSKPLPGYLISMIDSILECNKNKVGFFGGSVVDENGTYAKAGGRFTNWVLQFVRVLRQIKSSILGGLYNLNVKKVLANNKQISSYDYISGSNLWIRREVLSEVGLFDESFFLYSEEVDLQKRARMKGWKNKIISDAFIVHVGGGSFSEEYSRRLRLEGGYIRYLTKYTRSSLLGNILSIAYIFLLTINLIFEYPNINKRNLIKAVLKLRRAVYPR